MKKILLVLLLLLSTILTSCYKTEALEQYVGVYKLGLNYQREYHYYWGKSTKTSEKTIVPDIKELEITNDGKVIVRYNYDKVETGRVSSTKETIKFSGVDYISGYTFTFYQSDTETSIKYQYTQTKIGLEYDYKSEGISFFRGKSPEFKNEYTFRYVIATYTRTNIYPTYKNVVFTNKNYNNLKDAQLHIKYDTKEASVKIGSTIQTGTFDIVDEKKYIFHFDYEKPLIPVEREFIYRYQTADNCIYLNLDYKTTEEFENYIREDEYNIHFYTKR